MELDHVFILCDEGAPEAEALLRIGVREGTGNTHPGQGTACRRFFFTNAYLELLWVVDSVEAGSEPARRTRLLDRWALRRAGACPFGVMLRPSIDSVETSPTGRSRVWHSPGSISFAISRKSGVAAGMGSANERRRTSVSSISRKASPKDSTR